MDTIFQILGNGVNELISVQTAAVAIAVIGLNLHFGFTGMLNIGQAGFMLLGAYGFAISTIQGLPLPLAVLIGLGMGLIFALILGIPTLKLRGDYLAIVTISAAEIVRFLGRLSVWDSVTGGAQGLRGQEYQGPFLALSPLPDEVSWTISPFNYDSLGGSTGIRIVGLLVVIAAIVGLILVLRKKPAATATYLMAGLLVVVLALSLFFTFPKTQVTNFNDGWWPRFVAWFAVLVSLGVFLLLVKSPWGRLLRGIREDEDAMRSLGKNVFGTKLQALIIGGMFGALGGIIYVSSTTVQADGLGRQMTFFAYTALLLGGAATIFGPVLGTILFYVARILIRDTARAYIPDSLMNTQQTEQFSFAIVGIALILLVVFRPQGILGDKREVKINV